MSTITIPTIRLAHFVPLDDKDVSKTTKKDLVINALLLLNELSDEEKINDTLKYQLGCELGLETIEEVLADLVNENHVVKSAGNFMLHYKLYSKLDAERNKVLNFQEDVLNRWISEHILHQYPVLNEDNIIEIRNGLIEFLNKMFLSHGLESKNLIDGDINQTDNSFLTEDVFGSIKFNDLTVKKICRDEYYKFLSSSDANIRRYLEILIDKSFRYLSTICDPQVFETIKGEIEGKTIYLDSSIVYRLFNLQGEHRYRVTREVIQLCNEYNLKIKVSFMTYKELQRRINFDSRVLRNYPIPTNLSAIGINFFTEDNFVSTYWRLNNETNLDLEDFIAKYKNIDVLLHEEGVEVEKSLPEHTEEFNEEWDNILSKINNRDDHKKNPLAAEHDAYLICLINELRNKTHSERFIDSPAWFLTSDQFLIRLQKTEYDFKEKLPFALLPSQLIHLLRLAKPTDGKFNEMFLDVFSRSYVSVSDGLSNESIQKILARIGQYKGYTPLLAEKVLSDQFFTLRYQHSTSEGEQEELIHETIVEKAEELELLVNKKDSELGDLKQQLENLKLEMNSILSVKDSELRIVTGELEKTVDEASVAASTIELLHKKIESLERRQNERDEEERVTRENKKQRRRVIFNVLFQVLYLSLAAYCCYLIKDSSLEKIFKSVSMSLLTMGIVPITWILYKNKKVATIISAFVGMLFTVSAWFYSVI